MIRRQMGRGGPEVNAIGLGCMGMSAAYGEPMETNEAVKLLHAALDRGVDHFDTAELYGFGANETLLGEAFHDRREKAFIATKFGPIGNLAERTVRGVDGSEANMRRAIEQSLRLLRTDYVDLYYLHRKDPSRPIEETVEAMAKLVQEGRVRAIGLSEVNAETLRRAQAVHPIAAVQWEYSIFTRDVEAEVLPLCWDTGVTLVAYSPLGRGMLTGAFTRDRRPEGQDYRAVVSPRFQGEAYEANLQLVEELGRVAEARGATPSQVALAWVLASKPNVVTIPGTTKLANLEANLKAADVTLTSEEMARLDGLADKVKGTRYDERGMTLVNA
ncbi:MAG: aldo/keto reductase [Phenylobacterium sp.]|uniref:aldo/keto reductase n=1 Tax=Phenylobacterium sp. TaxID=1871053 RepID=UPI00391D1E0B